MLFPYACSIIIMTCCNYLVIHLESLKNIYLFLGYCRLSEKWIRLHVTVVALFLHCDVFIMCLFSYCEGLQIQYLLQKFPWPRLKCNVGLDVGVE